MEHQMTTPHVHPPTHEPQGRTALDPVCGMRVDPARASGGALVHEGVEYAFCSLHCRRAFDADPAKYVAAEPTVARAAHACCGGAAHAAAPSPAVEAPVAPPGTVYTCPMHPEIEQIGPGTCPLCGMRDRIFVSLAKILLQVHARAPAIPRPREHDDFSLIIGFQPVEDFLHLYVERRTHGIAFLRPIEGDPGNAFIVGLDQHAGVFFLLGHRGSPFLNPTKESPITDDRAAGSLQPKDRLSFQNAPNPQAATNRLWQFSTTGVI
jgi:YHS domain-containing protein